MLYQTFSLCLLNFLLMLLQADLDIEYWYWNYTFGQLKRNIKFAIFFLIGEYLIWISMLFLKGD